MKIRYLGHASFIITSDDRTKIITDPYTTDPGSGISYGEIHESADIVTVSHDHYDHNNAAAIRGNPAVIKEAATTEIKGVKFKGIPSYHDEVVWLRPKGCLNGREQAAHGVGFRDCHHSGAVSHCLERSLRRERACRD